MPLTSLLQDTIQSEDEHRKLNQYVCDTTLSRPEGELLFSFVDGALQPHSHSLPRTQHHSLCSFDASEITEGK